MDIFDGILFGFSVALEWQNLLYVALGVVLGTVIGLLPGLGPTASIAVLLPVTFQMPPESAIIMLAGIYYGCMYGGRIPAILLNIPGDASAVVTTMDGYPLARAGRAGPALGITAFGSFIGGSIAIIGLTLFAPLLASYASQIGPPETMLLALGGLLLVSLISNGGRIKSLCMAVLGLLLAAIGIDSISGTPRLTFDSFDLSNGIDIIPLAVGLFGFGEMLLLADRKITAKIASKELGGLYPSKEDWKIAAPSIMRSSILGFFIGILPGGGGSLSSIVSYGLQKRLSKNPEKFGKGAIDGLAATETADNASSNSAFIPLLTLGLPPNSVLALLFGVLLINNVTPGPQLIETHPEVFWGVIASMYIGNIILLVFNVPLIGVFVKLLQIPTNVMFPFIVVIAFCGVYSANNSLFDVFLAVVFGVVGYLLKKFRFDLTPIILAFILGPILESQFRRSMLMSQGDISIFVDRPGALGIVLVIVAIVAFGVFSSARAKLVAKRAVFSEQDLAA
ncbi:tripartite tricarboxylate transporter permease [Brevibacterium antiquum]|uniref:Putative tricarboxylic transport membrane protein n=1 Tax=Brevibacterium antiquum CNRZ 918 TaxID=1255637 RepID=A0A2H1L057_9MICO|nr:tripartite tricarboxylate transporter permease [Brevibacterium antiquum]SMY05396.1 putative tricarboxylic transport membrane protein [Brevibacterium antiquum CNRZ 918]